MEPRKYYVFKITNEGKSIEKIAQIDFKYCFRSAKKIASELNHAHRFDLHPKKHFYVSDDPNGWD